MRVKVEIEINLEDWKKIGSLTLKEHIAEFETDDRSYTVDQSLGRLHFYVSQKGTTHRAILDIRPLLYQMANALKEKGDQL